MKSEEWLTSENETQHEDRVTRLDWLAARMPDAEFVMFHGGLTTKYLFVEARYCFVYGQFLASIVLGFAFIEHTLASLLYATGRKDLERANASRLLREALAYGWIDPTEFDHLDRIRSIRNPITHSHRPGDEDALPYRAVIQNELLYALTEEDAQHVIEVVMHILNKSLF